MEPNFVHQLLELYTTFSTRTQLGLKGSTALKEIRYIRHLKALNPMNKTAAIESNGDADDLPEGWTAARLFDLCRPTQWPTIPTSALVENGFPVYGANGRIGFYSEFNHEEPTILITCRGATCGTLNVCEPKSYVTGNAMALDGVPIDLCPLRYLFFALHARGFEDTISGSAQPQITRASLEPVCLPLAPLPEQRRIVAKVEQLLGRVNAARERLAKVPAIVKRFRQSILAAACSGQLTADWREKNTPTVDGAAILSRFQADRKRRLPDRKAVREWPDQLFELPETWTWAQWNDLVDWITYGFTRPMPHVARGIPIVTAKNIFSSRINWDSTDYTTKSAYEELSEKDRPRTGEILLTKDGSIGRAAIVESDDLFCINQSVAVLRFGGATAEVKYLLRVIEARFTQTLIDEGAKGSAIRHISITAFAQFPCPLPPTDEQLEIVRRVDSLFALADKIESRVQAATARVEKITQAILAKAFRGELVPTEAELARQESRDYEPASVLLERIRAEPAADEGTSSRGARGQHSRKRAADSSNGKPHRAVESTRVSPKQRKAAAAKGSPPTVKRKTKAAKSSEHR